jgi:hypothetical protein
MFSRAGVKILFIDCLLQVLALGDALLVLITIDAIVRGNGLVRFCAIFELRGSFHGNTIADCRGLGEV